MGSLKITKKLIEYVYTCSCERNKITLSLEGENQSSVQKALRELGWYRSRRNSEDICPECYNAEQEKMSKSENIIDRINAGCYEAKTTFPTRKKCTDEADYDRKRNAFLKEREELHKKFTADAIEFVGLTNHPKAKKAFDLAWDEEHSGGLSDVISLLARLAELLNDDESE